MAHRFSSGLRNRFPWRMHKMDKEVEQYALEEYKEPLIDTQDATEETLFDTREELNTENIHTNLMEEEETTLLERDPDTWILNIPEEGDGTGLALEGEGLAGAADAVEGAGVLETVGGVAAGAAEALGPAGLAIGGGYLTYKILTDKHKDPLEESVYTPHEAIMDDRRITAEGIQQEEAVLDSYKRYEMVTSNNLAEQMRDAYSMIETATSDVERTKIINQMDSYLQSLSKKNYVYPSDYYTDVWDDDDSNLWKSHPEYDKQAQGIYNLASENWKHSIQEYLASNSENAGMSKNQHYARLHKTLLQYGISWAEHRESPMHLFLKSKSYRQYWYDKLKHTDADFTWWNKSFNWKSAIDSNKDLLNIITEEKSNWITGNYGYRQRRTYS